MSEPQTLVRSFAINSVVTFRLHTMQGLGVQLAAATKKARAEAAIMSNEFEEALHCRR